MDQSTGNIWIGTSDVNTTKYNMYLANPASNSAIFYYQLDYESADFSRMFIDSENMLWFDYSDPILGSSLFGFNWTTHNVTLVQNNLLASAFHYDDTTGI
jgi:hypothetical protein